MNKTNINIFFLFAFIFHFFNCSTKKEEEKKDKFTSIEMIMNEWQKNTYKTVVNNKYKYMKEGADSLSIENYSIPIFEKFISNDRAICLKEFKKKNYNPFLNFNLNDFIILEIIREDNCNTREMHIILLDEDNISSKKWSFSRTCLNTHKTFVDYNSTFKVSNKKMFEKFNNEFKSKGGFRNYTGIITFVTNRKFTCLPLFYLNSNEVVRLRSLVGG